MSSGMRPSYDTPDGLMTNRSALGTRSERFAGRPDDLAVAHDFTVERGYVGTDSIDQLLHVVILSQHHSFSFIAHELQVER